MNALPVRRLHLHALSALVLASFAAGCAQKGAPSDAPAPAPAAAPAPAGAKPAAAPAPGAAKVGPGMNAQGQVVDSKLVEAGYGQKVKGLDNWEGEITGKPAPNSKFTRLQIGMTMKQASDIAGMPSDQGGYMTGKAWIPFNFGSDRYRHELVYKGMGRLIFAGGGGWSPAGGEGNLIWIIHNANEGGKR
ncbi:hypothetical protein ACVNIS_02750 [Sphaerotilaceae bacterium SBD11-9]